MYQSPLEPTFRTDDLDPMLVGQFHALKNQEFERFRLLQRRQVEFNIDDIELSDFGKDEPDEKIDDKIETQSYLNEITSEIDKIQNEINNANEE